LVQKILGFNFDLLRFFGGSSTPGITGWVKIMEALLFVSMGVFFLKKNTENPEATGIFAVFFLDFRGKFVLGCFG